MADQGGASTEVSVFDNGECAQSQSIDVGTEWLKRIVMSCARDGASLMRALREAKDELEQAAAPLLDAMPEPVADGAMCIGVGSAITRATGLIGSPAQHDKVLTLEHIENTLADATDRLTARYVMAADLCQAFGRDRQADELLTMVLGLPFYAMLLRNQNLTALTVSGTGLWYGIYYQQLLGL